MNVSLFFFPGLSKILLFFLISKKEKESRRIIKIDIERTSKYNTRQKYRIREKKRRKKKSKGNNETKRDNRKYKTKETKEITARK